MPQKSNLNILVEELAGKDGDRVEEVLRLRHPSEFVDLLVEAAEEGVELSEEEKIRAMNILEGDPCRKRGSATAMPVN